MAGAAASDSTTALRDDVAQEVLLARAYLSRVAEPTCIPLWRDISLYGPVAVADAIRGGDASPDLHRATASRAATTDPHSDLEVAARHGIRLLTPEMRSWPHIAFACLESTAQARLATYEAGARTPAMSGELIPPTALWVLGPHELSAMSLRSVAVVGARACTPYGELVTKTLAYGLALREFDIVSGGAFGIDAVAHRAALTAGGNTVIVTAGGVDSPYPLAHRRLFEQVADSGAIVSESPPGSAPQRRRFLTRNRLVAALSTGSVVVEAARRSGAINTAAHTRDLGRTLMAVPGPVTSALSSGCHRLIADPRFSAALVTDVGDVIDHVGCAGDVSQIDQMRTPPRSESRDCLDLESKQILDGLPGRGSISIDRLAVTSGVPIAAIIARIAVLEIDGHVVRSGDEFSIARRSRDPGR